MRLLLFYMIYISANVYCDILRIPLYKSTPSRSISEQFNTYIKNGNMRDEHGKSSIMNMHFDVYYYGEIRIGTPEQIIKVDIDTSRPNLFVPANCTFFKANCYNISASKTSHEYPGPLPKKLTSNNFKAYLSLDKLSIGELAVEDQVLINVEYSDDFLKRQFGILGLSYPKDKTDKIDHRASVISNMMNRGVLRKPMFCIYFNRDINSDLAGQLVLGGSYDNQYKGEIKYLTTISEKDWKINMDEVGMGDHILCSGKLHTYIESAHNFIYGPRSEIKKIHEAMNATFDEKYKIYTVDCKTTAQLPDIRFTLEGRVFTLKEGDYIIKELGPICFSAFISIEYEIHSSMDYLKGYWILGNPFLKTVYTQFELNGRRIGFAERNFNSQ